MRAFLSRRSTNVLQPHARSLPARPDIQCDRRPRGARFNSQRAGRRRAGYHRRAVHRPPEGRRVDLQLRRRRRLLRIREFSLYERAPRSVGQSERELDRGLREAGAHRRVAHGQERVGGQAERRGRGDLLRAAADRRRRGAIVRTRGRLHQVELRHIARHRRECAFVHGRPCVVHDRPRHGHLGWRGGRWQLRRLLEQRAQSVGLRRTRYVRAGAQQSHGVLSGPRRAARGEDRHASVRLEL